MSRDTLRDNRRQKFFITDNDIIDDYGDKIGVYGFAVYSLLLRYAGATDAAFPSYQTIANKFGFSERQAIRTVALLVEVGLIGKEARLNANGATTSNLYTLVDLPSYDSQSPPPMTVSHRAYDRESPNKEPMNKTQSDKDKSISARGDAEPNLTPPRARAKTVRLGSVVTSPVLDISVLEEETAKSEDLDSEPNDSANGDPNGLSAAPPGLTPAQSMALGMLTDPEVGAYSQDVERWTKDPGQALKVVWHVGAWWSDHYLRKTAETVGSLRHRIDKCNPNQWPKEFLASAFYQRHYPLTEREARSRENRKRYAGFPVMGLSAGNDNQLDPDLVRLLDALPVPLWEEEPPC